MSVSRFGAFAHEVRLEDLPKAKLLEKVLENSEIAKQVLRNAALYGKFLKYAEISPVANSLRVEMDGNVIGQLKKQYAGNQDVLRFVSELQGREFPLNGVIDDPIVYEMPRGCRI